MKKFKIILVWIAISLILQCSVLFFLDKFYFKDNTDVSMEQVQINSDKNTAYEHVSIPYTATDIKISYNGRYIIYKDNSRTYIYDTKTGEINNFNNYGNGEVLEYTWLADRDIVLTLVKEDGQIVLYNYYPEKGEYDKIVDICRYSSLYKNYDIKVSTITGVTYVKLNNSIYRIDINQDRAHIVSTRVKNIGDLELMPTKDRIVYIAKGGSVLHLTQPNERIEIKQSKGPYNILGIDEEGVIYIGQMQNNKVVNILTKDIDGTSLIKTIKLDEPVNPKDIYISGTGEIYVNNELENFVKELKSGKEIKYDGEFLTFYSNGIATLVDGKYYKTNF